MPTGRKTIVSDLNANPALRKDLQRPREEQDRGEKVELPKRFEAKPVEGKPGFKITDSTTGRSVVVQLHAFPDVKKTLANLFPNE